MSLWSSRRARTQPRGLAADVVSVQRDACITLNASASLCLLRQLGYAYNRRTAEHQTEVADRYGCMVKRAEIAGRLNGDA